MNMNDRKKLIEENGENLCQTGCSLKGYDQINTKIICICDINKIKTVSNLNDISFNSMLLNNIFGELKYSNYLVLKCYKLLLDFELIKKNIGFIFVFIIVISLIIIIFIVSIKGTRKIDFYIQVVLKNKLIYINSRNNMKNRTNIIKDNKKNNINF